MKIALLAFYFYPDESIGASRPESWARCLSRSHEVEVITSFDADCEGLERHEGFRVRRPVGFLLGVLRKYNSFRQRRRLSAQVNHKFSDKAVSPVRKKRSGAFTYRMPCFYDIWFFSALFALFRVRPDVVIATHGPYVTLVVAWVYSLLNSKVKLWVDFRDLWAGNYSAPGLPGIRLLERFLEAQILKRADRVTTVSEGLADYFRGTGFSSKVQVIYNAPAYGAQELAASNDLQSAVVSSAGAGIMVKLCYTGTIYPDGQDISPLFQLFQSVERDAKIGFRLMIASRNVGNCLSLASQFECEQYVDFLGAVPRKTAFEIQQAADILVLLDWLDIKAKGVLTGKVFEYLSTEKPILLIGAQEDSELFQLLKRHERLITLAELREVLLGNSTLRKCLPVDYFTISSAKVLEIAGSLSR